MITELMALSFKPYMEVQEFAIRGYLQEANRRFFHPLGLMLHAGFEERRLVLKGVIDCRDDPAGIVFAGGDLAAAGHRQAAELISRLWAQRGRDRLDECGFMIQPPDKL
ncbi:MAG: hypothetical protein ACE5HQ_08910 [Gemmatimonadota bacterium]